MAEQINSAILLPLSKSMQEGTLMTDQKNRVLARNGARNLKLEEIDQVSGTFGTPILMTEKLTTPFPGHTDREFDEMQA